MQAEGVVVELSGKKAWVQVERTGGCGRCKEPGGCGAESDAERRCSRYLVDNACAAPLGAQVGIEVPEGAALTAALLSYGVPLTGLLLGTLLATVLSAQALAAPLGAVLGLVLAFAGLRLALQGGRLRHLRPRITAVIAS